MSLHAYNHGLVTSSKGATIEFAKVTGLNVAPVGACTVDDYASNFVQSVTHTATGVYSVQLNKPYPAALTCLPSISSTSPTTDLIFARYKDASYSPTAGTFEVHLVNDDDAGAGVAVAGLAANELTLLMIGKRYNNLP